MLPGRKLAHLEGRHIGTLNLRELITFLTAAPDFLSPESRRHRWGRFIRWLWF